MGGSRKAEALVKDVDETDDGHLPLLADSEDHDLSSTIERGVRKLFIRICPMLLFFMIMMYSCRTLMSYANLRESFQSHFDWNDAQYGLASGLFYVTYITF